MLEPPFLAVRWTANKRKPSPVVPSSREDAQPESSQCFCTGGPWMYALVPLVYGFFPFFLVISAADEHHTSQLHRSPKPQPLERFQR